MGSQGIYQQTNVEKRRPYTLGQWHSLCQEDDHKPPDLSTDRTTKPVTLNKKRRRPSITNMDADETNISPYENVIKNQLIFLISIFINLFFLFFSFGIHNI